MRAAAWYRRRARLRAEEQTRHAVAPWRRAHAEPGGASAGGRRTARAAPPVARARESGGRGVAGWPVRSR